MKSVSFTDLRKDPLAAAKAIEDALKAGQGLEITKRGRVVGVIGKDRPSKEELQRQLAIMREADKSDDYGDYVE